MFVGHALLAFALVGGGGRLAGWSRERALAVGALAGAFAAVPDVDIVYAILGPLTAATANPLALADSFWATGSLVHRSVTHSVVVAPVVAAAAALWVGRERLVSVGGIGALSLVGGFVVAALLVGGVVEAAVACAFGIAALGVATAASRRLQMDPKVVFATALFGFVSHPLGDLFTGEPPALLYPVWVAPVGERVALSADPTVHLLGAFAIELATVWLALGVGLHLTGARARVAPRATLGAGYAAVLPVIPLPTLDLSYPFVFSLLAVGALGLAPHIRLGAKRAETSGETAIPRVRRPESATALLTAVTTVTVAWGAYTAAYLWTLA